jgi:hypothetical protein
MTIVCLFNPNHHWLQYTHIYPPLHMRHTYCHKVHLYTAQSTKVYVPSSELGLSHPLSRQRVGPSPRYQRGGGHTRLRVRGWGSPNSEDLRTSLALFLFCACCSRLIYSISSSEFGNLKSENSQDYAQKPQRNYTFMNSTSVESALFHQWKVQYGLSSYAAAFPVKPV